jgi:hypothetical protein
MEIGEPVSAPSLAQEMEEKCPFDDKPEEAPKLADESVADDDLSPQANDGGILGGHLTAGTKGVADGGPYPPTDYLWRHIPDDSYRGRCSALQMTAWRDAPAGDYPYVVAAHHLIPGNAALKRTPLLMEYMKKGGSVESQAGKKYTINGDIGYDVNGSHNGAWLPGNYAIKTALPPRTRKDGVQLAARVGTTPVPGVSWGALAEEHEMWQYNYVASAAKAASGQFHDSHEEPYSKTVRENLDKITLALAVHLDTCEKCKGRKAEISPPYRIKRRLYAMSKRLRGYVSGTPGMWKAPFFTSQRWSEIFLDDAGNLTKDFLRRYAQARETDPHTIGP